MAPDSGYDDVHEPLLEDCQIDRSEMADSDGKDGELPTSAKASAMEMGFNLSKNLVGAALLSLPYTLRESGVVFGLGLLAIVHFFSAIGFLFLGEVSAFTGAVDALEAGKRSVGRRFGLLLESINGLYALGALVAYFVILGDYLPSILAGLGVRRQEEGGSMVSSLLLTRWFPTLVTMAAVTFPMTLAQNLAMFSRSSQLGIGALGLAFVVMVQKISCMGLAEGVSWKYGSPSGIILSVPIMGVCASAHYNSFRYWRELKDKGKFVPVTVLSFAVCYVFYSGLAVAAYLHLGERTPGNLLNAYPSEDALALIARLALLVSILLTFPLVYSSLRNAICSVAFHSRFDPGFSTRCLFGLSLVSLMASLGIFVRRVDKVFNVLGSFVGSLICYIIPASLSLKLTTRHNATRLKMALALATLLFGIVVLLVSTATQLVEVAHLTL